MRGEIEVSKLRRLVAPGYIAEGAAMYVSDVAQLPAQEAGAYKRALRVGTVDGRLLTVINVGALLADLPSEELRLAADELVDAVVNGPLRRWVRPTEDYLAPASREFSPAAPWSIDYNDRPGPGVHRSRAGALAAFAEKVAVALDQAGYGWQKKDRLAAPLIEAINHQRIEMAPGGDRALRSIKATIRAGRNADMPQGAPAIAPQPAAPAIHLGDDEGRCPQCGYPDAQGHAPGCPSAGA